MGVNSKVGVATDIDGKFTLSLPESEKQLRVSYVGMETQTVPVSSGFLHIALKENSTLQEVVVTGYGQTSKKAFTGAASVVDGSDIERRSDVNFVKGLEGNVTGFQYNNSTSSPGTWGSVYVRGLGSLSSGSTPLYVIDGIPVQSSYEGMSDNSNNYFDPMASYNPSDIESVTVLKDAAATAIYGSRAANGVIVITTKKGAQSKFQLDIDVKQGFQQVANNNMKYANAARTTKLFAQGYANYTGMPYDDAYGVIVDTFGWDGVSSYDWMDAVTRRGYYQDYNVSFSGSTGSTNYYVSLGLIDTKGIVINSDNKRYSGRVNLDTKYKFFSAGINASYSYSLNNNFSQSTSGSMSNPIVGAVSSMTPYDPFYNPDGSYFGAGSLYNPLALNDEKLGDLNRVTNQTFVANPWLRVDLPFGFWVKTNFGVNLVDQTEYNYWSSVYNPLGLDYNGLGQQYQSRNSTLTWTNLIGWNKTFNDINTFDVLLGQEMQRFERHYDYYARIDFPFGGEGQRDMTMAASPLDSEYYKEQSRLASYFIDAHYTYDDRYFFSASYRRDGSSIFGKDHRWGNFWSLGAKWRISSEKFAESAANWLSNADLHVSYGTVGNQTLPALYAARGLYFTGYNYMNTPGMTLGQIANDELSWETSRKFDVGFDLRVFNRASLTFDFYNEDTADALLAVPLSMTTGMSSVYQNIGKIRNTGVEIGLNGTVFTNDKVTVNLFANMTWNKNRVVKLEGGKPIEYTWQIIEEGKSYRQLYMPEYAGVNPENGRAQYWVDVKDENDKVVDSYLTEDYTQATKRYVGSADPKVYGAFGLSAQGWGVDLNVQFNYRAGGKVMNTGANFTGWGMQLSTPLDVLVDNSWTPENPNAEYPAFIYSDPYKDVNGNYSTRWLMSGNYLRLSNICVGYTLPKHITQKALMQKVRFYINLDNVWTWTRKSFIGYNPDTYANGQIAWQYPAAFTFTGGVQVTF